MSDLPALSNARATTALSSVTTDTSRLSTRANLEAAGEKFESIFTGMMLKSMRATKLATPLFDSQAIDQFRDMQDQKLAQSMASSAPMGIGKAMVDFLSNAQAETEARIARDKGDA